MEYIWTKGRAAQVLLVAFILFNLANRGYEIIGLSGGKPPIIQAVDDQYVYLSSVNVQTALPQDELLYFYLRADTIVFNEPIETKYRIVPIEEIQGRQVYAKSESAFLTD